MAEVGAPRRASYGSSAVVAIGWYATMLTAVVVGSLGIPSAPRQDCYAAFSCLSRVEEVAIMAVFVTPVVLVMLAVTLVIAIPLARGLPSAILAGTLATLVGGSAVAVVAGVIWEGVR